MPQVYVAVPQLRETQMEFPQGTIERGLARIKEFPVPTLVSVSKPLKFPRNGEHDVVTIHVRDLPQIGCSSQERNQALSKLKKEVTEVCESAVREFEKTCETELRSNIQFH